MQFTESKRYFHVHNYITSLNWSVPLGKRQRRIRRLPNFNALKLPDDNYEFITVDRTLRTWPVNANAEPHLSDMVGQFMVNDFIVFDKDDNCVLPTDIPHMLKPDTMVECLFKLQYHHINGTHLFTGKLKPFNFCCLIFHLQPTSSFDRTNLHLPSCNRSRSKSGQCFPFKAIPPPCNVETAVPTTHCHRRTFELSCRNRYK